MTGLRRDQEASPAVPGSRFFRGSGGLLPLRNRFTQVLVVLLFASTLYLPLLSIQYNPNGINEAINVEIGGRALFSPNHMAYRPVGAALWKVARALGYEGRSLAVLQILSAAAGALAVTFAFVAFRRLTKDFWPAAVGTVFLATTSYFWASSVDAFYVAPAAAFAAAAMAVVAGRAPAFWPVLAASVLTAASVLVWQANVFIILPLAVGLLTGRTEVDFKRRLIGAGSFAGATVALTGLAYTFVGVVVFGRRSVSSVMDWISNYAGARLPQWGTWDSGRVPVAVKSAFESLVPLRKVRGMKGIIEGGITFDSLAVAMALAVVVLLLVMAVVVVWRSGDLRGWLAKFGWLGVGYFGFMPFLVWWDPFEPKWFVVPNVFLAGLVAGAFSSIGVGCRTRAVASVSVVVVAAATLVVVIWPQHTTESLRQRRAACVAEHLGSRDLFIATDWRWDAYLNYFHDIRAVSTIGLASQMKNPDLVVESVQNRVIGVQSVGANAFRIDLSYYPRGHLIWLESQTGLSRAMIESIEGEPAFECFGVPLLRLDDPR